MKNCSPVDFPAIAMLVFGGSKCLYIMIFFEYSFFCKFKTTFAQMDNGYSYIRFAVD